MHTRGEKVTPVSGADLFPLNKSHNTWNGPIMGPYDGKYHLFLPYYGTRFLTVLGMVHMKHKHNMHTLLQTQCHPIPIEFSVYELV